MSSTDQKKFENVFGSNMFVGYVLKRENDGWHIDGILKKDQPVYVVDCSELRQRWTDMAGDYHAKDRWGR